MRWIADKTVDHLRSVLDAPDLNGTKYRLVGELGRGGMGAVYLAEDSELERRVALKVLNVVDSTGEGAARMLREARILARLEHPSIVPVHDVGTLPDGRIFYVMKLVEGTRLDGLREKAGSLAGLLRVFQKACQAVAFAHSRGVIHRDLKPENIMVGSFGEALIMDWGVAKVLGENAAPERGGGELREGTAHGTVMGTRGYMAPEQARGEVGRVDERADVYALGAILRFLLPERAPRPLGAIAGKAMAADPGERYASVRELGADVARFLDGLPVEAYPEGIFERAGRIVSRNRMAVVLILAYLAMRVLLFFFTRR